MIQAEVALNLDLKFAQDSLNNALGVYLDNQEVSSELRTEKTAELASKFAMIGQLRESLLEKVLKMGDKFVAAVKKEYAPGIIGPF